jgi:hypothetical protein
MRKWIPIALIALSILWWVLSNIGYSTALTEFAARPITALSREGIRIPVQPSGRKPQPDEARGLGGQGVMFGLSMTYALPDGALVTCTQRFTRLTCDGGWTPDRAAQ